MMFGIAQKNAELYVMASVSCAVSGVSLYAASEVIVYLAVLVADLKASNERQNESNKALQWMINNWPPR